jgi:hypothetical protein
MGPGAKGRAKPHLSDGTGNRDRPHPCASLFPISRKFGRLPKRAAHKIVGLLLGNSTHRKGEGEVDVRASCCSHRPNFRVCTYIGKTGLLSFQEISLRRNLGTRTEFHFEGVDELTDNRPAWSLCYRASG